jgi:hypothetical protein
VADANASPLPSSVSRSLNCNMSQSRIVPSLLAEASSLPSLVDVSEITFLE